MKVGGDTLRAGKARSLAVRSIARIFDDGAYANLVTSNALKNNAVSARDAALYNELVHGTTRRINTIDYILDKFLRTGKLTSLPPLVRDALRVGAYQLTYLNGIEDGCAVDASVSIVKASKYKGFAPLINGVLRSIARSDRAQLLDFSALPDAAGVALEYSFPLWLVEKWLHEASLAEVRGNCLYFNRPKKIVAYCNYSQQNITALVEALEQEGYSASIDGRAPGAVSIEKGFNPGSSLVFRLGGMHIVDFPSILIARAVDAQPGERILDVCAAPGGKTFCLAAAMAGQGELIACDADAGRLRLLHESMKRLNYSEDFLHLCQRDALTAPPEGWVDNFDKVLLDAPCSGTGVLGSKSDSRWRKTKEMIENLASLQVALLDRVMTLVKPGGDLIYSTCSMEREEGEKVISSFLTRHTAFKLIPFPGKDVDWASYIDLQGFFRSYPYRHELDGFFMARLRRDGAN